MRRIGELLGASALVAVPLALGLLLAVPAVQGAGDHPGKAVFLAQKCTMCHSVDSQGIACTTKSEKVRGPDLSDEGSKRSAEWVGKWLRKQEKIEGKVHKKEFKGTDQELADLIAFLGTLKKG
jgi:cytochrome c2